MLKFFSDTIKSFDVKFIIRSNSDTVKTSQVIFHAMFGTYLDDLSICSGITSYTGKWFQRKDLNPVFAQRGAAPQITLTPIYFKKVSKMAQALLTKSLGNVDPVTTCRPSFSGHRTRTFTAEFVNYLKTGKASQNYSSDPVQLQYALKKTKDQILEDLNNVKIMKAGTTHWESKNEEGIWVPTDFVAAEGDIKFFGK